MDMGTKVLYSVLLIVVGFIWVGLCAAMGVLETAIPYIGFFILAPLIIMAGFLADEKKKSKKLENYVFLESTGNLHIRSRNLDKLRYSLRIEPARTVQQKYNPATLEYTGVTIGGITTGSFHVNEASISAAAYHNTGKYQLVLKEGGYKIVNKITLPDSMLEEAKKTPVVKDFIRNGCLELKHDGIETELTASERETIAAARRQGRQDIVINATLRSVAASYLTKEECETIKQWLCG